MSKRIVIKIGAGSVETGYVAAVQIGEEGATPQVETQANLPPAPDLPDLYQRWQQAYWQLGNDYRLEPRPGITHVSDVSRKETCQALSRELRDRVHHWLNSEPFRPIREKLLEQLNPQDAARILLQTQDPLLQRLPWYELHFFQRYRQAEVGIGAPNYQQTSYPGTRSGKVRILAVLGDATGLNTATDEALLKQLPDVDIHFLKAPSREVFNQCLWDIKGWDILFFAGHSRSSAPCPEKLSEGSGEMMLNATDKLTIPQLKHALSKAIDRGLNTAIFNSCDGLGLAADLADLHIPQVLVMREPVPDQVAHAFLKGFLESFSAGTSFYLSIREAREKLQGLESRFPCATWLPVIVQNLAETPPTWQSLQGKQQQKKIYNRRSSDRLPAPTESQKKLTAIATLPWRYRLKIGIGSGIVIATVLLLGRQLGFLEPFELNAYDVLLTSRPPENVDPRLLIIINTQEDIERFPNPTGKSSLADETLISLFDKIIPLEPSLIGLDIYHDHKEKSPVLSQRLQNTDNLVTICKHPDATTTATSKAQPPEVQDIETRVGFNDFLEESGNGNILRRHLIQMEPPADSPCEAQNAFSTQLAWQYLKGNGATGLPIEPISQSNVGGYHDLDVQGGSQILLNYRILKDPQQTNCGGVVETPADCITVSQLLEQSPESLRNSIEGRIVLIGTTDADYAGGDRWRTPYNKTAILTDQAHGIFLQAQMISQLLSATLDNRPIITSWPEWQEMSWIAGWAILGGFVGSLSYGRWGLRMWLRLLTGEGLLLLACWLWLTHASLWIPWIPSAIALPAAAFTTKTVLTTKAALNITKAKP